MDSALSDTIVFLKYARFREDLQRRETWDEIVDRNAAMHKRRFAGCGPEFAAEIDEAFQLVREKKVLPSMRSMQFGGEAIEKNNVRMYNCSYLPIDSIDSFAETLFLLLSGTGVGFSVQKMHVKRLMETCDLRTPSTSAPYLVGDTIEGWAEALEVLLKAYLEGWPKPRFDFSAIRPAGSPLKTAGGFAPGPEPLKRSLEAVEALLLRRCTTDARSEPIAPPTLRPIDCHDIVCHMADCVAAGGIRRSALISLFSPDDAEMVKCKSGPWWAENPQRGRANNSVVLSRDVDADTFRELWSAVEASGAGEPGFYFTNDNEWGVNPCCIAGDTLVLTDKGPRRADALVGEPCSVLVGASPFGSVVQTEGFFKTGEKEVFELKTDLGYKVKATADHRFMAIQSEGETSTADWAPLSELAPGVSKVALSEAGYIWDRYADQNGAGGVEDHRMEGGMWFDRGDADGMVLGHAVSHSASPYDAVALVVNDPGYALDVLGKRFPGQCKFEDGRVIIPMSAAVACDHSLSEMFTRGVHYQYACGFIRGVTASGVGKFGEYNVGGLELEWSQNISHALQLMLHWSQSIATTDEEGHVISWEKIENGSPKAFATVTSIERVGVEPVYDITVPGVHEFSGNGFRLHNCEISLNPFQFCNICDINASTVVDQADLDRRARAAAFIGTLQAAYTTLPYLRKEWEEVTEREALLGVGLTGIASGRLDALDLRGAARCATDENIRVAKRIGISRAARVTTVKPSGTASLVLDCSSGIHAWHAPYYVRRIRVGSDEAIAGYFRREFPELIEPDVFSPTNSVISFPVKAPEGSTYRDEPVEQFLERVLRYNREWIGEGHVYGANRNNVSATVSVRQDEWKKVGDWLYENRDSYNGISVLPYDGGTYQQAPFEDCDAAEFERLKDILQRGASGAPFDLTAIRELEDRTDALASAACDTESCMRE